MSAPHPPPRKRSALRKGALASLQEKQAAARAAPTQQPTCCENPQHEDDDEGHIVCRSCFTQIADSNIVADVTFQEDSRGQAQVQGGFIGENARHARTLGSATFRRVGGGEKDSSAEAQRNCRQKFNGICPGLSITENVSNQGVTLYGFAFDIKFSAGRSTDEVMAACLYAACRRQKDNTVLLIDIAELMKINVFRLGEVYKSLCTALYLDQKNVGTQYLVEVESLIMKYCRRLEFGDATRQVAEDALKIVRRMKRDWMVYGRHPAGLCGASIILAARMNNFRRTTREVVYVAKVADMTIAKRIEEFRRTKSATMTVEQFRKYGVRFRPTHDPPVLEHTALAKQKFEEKKRRRREATQARETIDISDDEIDASSRATSVAAATPAPGLYDGVENERGTPAKRQRTSTAQPAMPAPTQQEPRRDADGFVIPPLPADVAGAVDENGQPELKRRRRGRPKKDEKLDAIEISEEELATEQEIEDEISFVLNDENIGDARTEVEKAKDEEKARLMAEAQMKAAAEETKARRETEGITWWNDMPAPLHEEVTQAELEAEFADDPEVLNCKLSPAEQIVKERIWVEMNEDWLRRKHEKELLATVAQAAGRDTNKKKGKRRRKGRMGDGTTMAEATTPIETPADANKAMLEKRAPTAFSKHVNYEALARIYRHSPSSSSASASRAGSQAPTPDGASTQQQERDSTSPSPAPSTTAGLQSPPPTQAVRFADTSPPTPARPRPQRDQPPATPPATQLQATAGAEDDDDESMGDPDDYVQDDLDYGSDADTPGRGVFARDDDRDDVGDEDYDRAINHPYALEADYGGEEYDG